MAIKPTHGPVPKVKWEHKETTRRFGHDLLVYGRFVYNDMRYVLRRDFNKKRPATNGKFAIYHADLLWRIARNAVPVVFPAEKIGTALRRLEEFLRPKAVQRCDLCDKPYAGKHRDPVSNKPRHPRCIPF